MQHSTNSALDGSATGLSLICLLHCLLLPVIGAALPLAGTLAEMEWIHKALVLTALPITALAIKRHHQSKVPFSFAIPAIIGLALLLTSGFVEEVHDFETPITAAGAILLGGAHIWRWINRESPMK